MGNSVMVAVLDDHIGEITLNRPDSLNTFTLDLASSLNEALMNLDADKSVRVIIIKGAGKAFCAGIDVGDFFDKSTMEYREWIECMETPLIAMSKIKKPVIAQVHGVAAANGAGIVAAADLAVMADNARMGLTAINVGLNCVGPVIPVSRCVGRKKALEMLLYGDLIKAPQALEMGLVNKLAPTDDLEAETRRWAAVLAKKSPVAVQIAKSAFYASADMEYDQAFAYMNEAFARLCSSADAKEGVSAFLEKRKPEWQDK